MNPLDKIEKLIISCTNIRALKPDCPGKASIIFNLNSTIRIILDAHIDEKGLREFKNNFKTEMSPFDTYSNFSSKRGILILVKKSSGFMIKTWT